MLLLYFRPRSPKDTHTPTDTPHAEPDWLPVYCTCRGSETREKEFDQESEPRVGVGVVDLTCERTTRQGATASAAKPFGMISSTPAAYCRMGSTLSPGPTSEKIETAGTVHPL